MKNFLNRAVFFIGWLLSPFTFWNDALVNIPIAYIAANIFIRVWPTDFLAAVVVFYWISNGLGILMMYLSGKGILKTRRGVVREIILLLTAMAVYSLLLAILNKVGFLRPV